VGWQQSLIDAFPWAPCAGGLLNVTLPREVAATSLHVYAAMHALMSAVPVLGNLLAFAVVLVSGNRVSHLR
jgi:hypothetical protein